MYDCGITAKEVIDAVISEADIAPAIPEDTYIRWLNQLEQNLYGSVITDTVCENAVCSGGYISISCPAEDVTAVFCGADELAKTTPDVLPLLANLNFYAVENGRLKTGYPGGAFTVCRRNRPALKTKDNYSTETVKIPYAFSEAVYAKLRGEAYKLANEDELAAKWLGDYNALIADLTVWHSARRGCGE